MRDYASLYTHLLADLEMDRDCADAPITSDMDARTVAKHSLASSFYKKLAPNGNTTVADANALKKFIAINEACSTYRGFEAESLAESYFYDYYRDNLALCFVPKSGRTFDLEYIREHMGVGPGAAQKADSRYMVSKLFESSLSYTQDDLIRYYRSALVETGLWADAEMRRFQSYGFTKVEGGKLFFASKNSEISRTCCTEAVLNMLIQKAVGAFLEESASEMFGISLSTQPDFNRELARIGSVYGTKGTMDLVSASDSIVYEALMRDVPDCFIKAMLRISRNEFAVLPDGEKLRLHMISTMGNGFTFPLQTVIFASAVKAVYDVMGIPFNCPRTDYGVFGDDIIVDSKAFEFLARMLTKLGYTVNVRKSFNTGLFRESCGSDWYAGTFVRGVYIRSLETPQEVYSAINRLLRWAARHGVCLQNTIGCLRSWARDIRVPPSESDDSGIHVPWRMSSATKVNDRYWYKYRAYRKQVRKMKVPESDADGVINPEGIGVGYLSGVVRRRDPSPDINLMTLGADQKWSNLPVEISLRDLKGARARYRVRSFDIPYWDYWPLTERVDSSDSDIENGVSLTRGSQHIWEDVLVAHFPIRE